MRTIQLREYKPEQLAIQELSPAHGERLWNEFREYVDVEFPTPRVANKWQLTSKGWVGFIPLDRDIGLALVPKVPLANLFGMLEVAYGLEEFKFRDGLVQSGSLDGYFDQMASVLVKRVLARGRKGYYRTYVDRREDLPYLRGRVDVASMVRSPWRIQLDCEFQEHTGDVVENQILIWTLWCLIRSGRCSPETLRLVRKASRGLAGVAATVPHLGEECVNRLYNRLNEDYEPLHALCRFFIEQLEVPAIECDGRRVLPFLVNMAPLFELFVAEWLKAHLLAEWRLRRQHHVVLEAGQDLRFIIDLVLEDAETGQTLCVLDTKYKDPKTVKLDDVQQVVAYAVARDVRDAVLIYPAPPPLTCAWVGDVAVHFLAFDVAGDLDEAGHQLLRDLRGIAV
jgi:5-methylcytosine-specific restriction enzyme subunit McrC